MKEEKVDLSGFEFFSSYSRVSSPDYAVLNPKTQGLVFSAILSQKLGIENWEYVLIGLNRQTRVIALKKTTAEEYGAKKIRSTNPECNASAVSLRGSVKYFGLETAPKYKPTKQGDILLLEPVE